MNAFKRIEKKVLAMFGVSGVATIIVTILHYADPALKVNPALVLAVVTVLAGAAGYVAPHTHLRPAPPKAPVTITQAPGTISPPPTTTTGPVKP